MQNSPLLLEKSFFVAVDIEAVSPGILGNRQPSSLVFAGKVAVEPPTKKEESWLVELTVDFLSPTDPDAVPPPYTGKMVVVGFFRVSEQYLDPDLAAFVHANGAAVLFGMVREMFAYIAFKGPWPVVPLPLVTFVDEIQGVATTGAGLAAADNTPDAVTIRRKSKLGVKA